MKGRDGSFTCDCGKAFKHPISLRQHGRECVGAELENDAKLADNMSWPEDSMNKDEVPEAEELGDCMEELGVCIGTFVTRIY